MSISIFKEWSEEGGLKWLTQIRISMVSKNKVWDLKYQGFFFNAMAKEDKGLIRFFCKREK